MLPEIFQELRRGDRLERVTVEIAAQETVKVLASNGRFNGAQERGALFIRNVRHRIVRVAAGQILIEARVLVRGSEPLDFRVERTAVENLEHAGAVCAAEHFPEAVLDVRGK